MTLLELIALALYVGVGIAAGRWAGSRFGIAAGILAFPIGIALLHGFFLAVSYVERLYWVGIPPLPRCRSGGCGPDDYKVRPGPDDIVYSCRCGGEYQKRGRRFFELRPDGSLVPFMVWKAFRGWFPDA
jgi:hypothetical protein